MNGNVWPMQATAAMNSYYGTSCGGNGDVDAKWERENIVSFQPTYKMVLAWDQGATVKGIRCHKKVATSLLRILARIAHLDPEMIHDYGLDQFGGAYNFRMTRGGTHLSCHAWGAAIDLNPAVNAWKRPPGADPRMMPGEVVALFEDEGWTWGGHFSVPDCMHFQAARI
jgi:hypothetical protein